jgi:hypothetical protein
MYIIRLNQGLLKLLWTVYSEGKSCLRHNMQKIGLKFAPVVELMKLNFTYLYHNTKIAKADDWPEHPSVQINSSSPWLNAHFRVTKLYAQLPH